MEILKKGSRGHAVKTLQYYLNMIEDGIFGALTEEAVKEFQGTHGLTADGVVGPTTWSKLTGAVTNRKINKIILHCTATPEGKDYSVDTIRGWHKKQGWSDIGYHWVIYRDGSIHEGRRESKIGAHCDGYNSTSIGIVYVGGVATDGKTAKDTRTQRQRESLVKLVKDLMRKYQLRKEDVYCHNNFAAKACPSFKRDTFLRELD